MVRQNRKARLLQKKPRGKTPVFLYLLVLLLLVALAGGTLAKYFRSRETEGTVRAQMFYFTSDFLNGTERKLNPGVTEVTFSVGNYADDLRVAEMNIVYTVTVTPALADGNVVCSKTTLTGGGKDDADITLKGLIPGQTYTVTVEAVGGGTTLGGYRKTLTGTVVAREEGVVYRYLEDKGSYVLLTVWAQGYSGGVIVGYPNGTIPDNTDPVMSSAVTDGGYFTDSVTFGTDPDASHSYRFFYSGTKPTVAQFPVTYAGTKEASEKMPD